MSEWKTIDTAPKDGSMFFGWVSAVQRGEADDGSYRETDVSDYDFCRWRSESFGEGEEGFFENMMGDIGDMQMITHWMTLPPPPTDSAP